MREEKVFEEALLQPAERRSEFLDSVCAGEAALRERVERMLQAHADPGSFLRSPAAVATALVSRPPVEQMVGTQIGPYRIREQIGEGGFGTVYVAEQLTPVSRKVALKVIKPGMDSKDIIARFESERQALAIMDHPNIAKVLDAGATDTGHPYFVMELVHGVPITEYADGERLSTQLRLQLFVDVCRAVQHAHQKGIIHRDLKPSNIMITMHDDKPVPKVIDFGVSKALSQRLTDKTVYTAYGQMVGTPLYMSPEQTQMSGLDVDTRSDVYSLGVLLYEMLTGTTPFDKETFKNADFDDIRRIIREDDPPRPSARLSTLDAKLLSTVSDRRRVDARKLGQLFRGELDWIVMKALEKDRTRRYDSANSFANDIERFLHDEAVEACPPSVSYRFRKFARRNRASLTTLSLTMAALVLGMLGTTWQALIANSERDRALIATQQSRVDQRAAEKAKELEEDLRIEAEKRLAASYLDHAQALCEDGEIGRGLLWLTHSLRTTPPDAKDLQHVIRMNLSAWRDQLHVLQGIVRRKEDVQVIKLGPDGRRMVSGLADGQVLVSDVGARDPERKLGQHTGVKSIAFSPNGSHFATASSDGTVLLWDAVTLRTIGKPLRPGGTVRSMVFNADATRFATASCRSGYWESGTVTQWDTATGMHVDAPFHHEEVDDQTPDHAIRRLAFTRLGLRAVFTVRTGEHQLWDIDRREPVGQVVNNPHTGAVAISPDGLRFAAGGKSGGKFRVWDAATGELTMELLHGGEIKALAFSNDGSRLLSGGSARSARLWDANTGQAIGVPMRHRGTVNFVAFRHDGQRILTRSEDGTARLWEVASGNSGGRLVEHEGRMLGATYGPDALYILTEADGAFQLRNAATGRAIGKPLPWEHAGSHHLVALSPDGSRVAIYEDGHTRLWNVTTGQSIGQLGEGRIGIARDAEFSPDGSRLLIGYQTRPGSGDGFAQLWDAQTAEPIGGPLEHDRTVASVAFSPEGLQCMTGSFDATTRLWDAATAEPIGEPKSYQSEIKGLAFNHDGARFVTGFADWTARLWDTATQTPIGVPLHHQNMITGAAFSPDDSLLITCSIDGTARIWDVVTLKPIGPPLRYSSSRARIFFRQDGAEFLIESGSTAQVWKSPPPPLDDDVERVALWAQVVTGLEINASGGIGVLNASTWQELSQELQETDQ